MTVSGQRYRVHVLKVFSSGVISRVALGVAAIIIIRVLPIRDYALYTLCLSIVSVITRVVASGFNRIFVVDHSGKMFKEDELTYLILQLALLSLLSLGSLIFVDASIVVKGAVVTLILGTGFNEFAKAYYQKRMQFGGYGWVETAAALSFLCLVCITGLLTNLEPTAGRVLTYKAGSLVLAGFGVGRILIRGVSLDSARGAVRLGRAVLQSEYRHMFGYFAALAVFAEVDVLLLSVLSDNAQMATYGSAFRYYSLLLTILGSVLAVQLPAVQRANDPNEIIVVVKQNTRLLLVYVPAIAAISFTAHWLIPIADGGKYPEAVAVFQILALSSVGSFWLSPYVHVLFKYGRVRVLFINALIALTLNVALNWMLIPMLGAKGAAVTTFLAYMYLNGVPYMIGRRAIAKDVRDTYLAHASRG